MSKNINNNVLYLHACIISGKLHVSHLSFGDLNFKVLDVVHNHNLDMCLVKHVPHELRTCMVSHNLCSVLVSRLAFVEILQIDSMCNIMISKVSYEYDILSNAVQGGLTHSSPSTHSTLFSKILPSRSYSSSAEK